MVEAIFLTATIATIMSLDVLGVSWQETVAAPIATLAGVFVALEAERRLAARREKSEAKQALQMRHAELEGNLVATERGTPGSYRHFRRGIFVART
jgi:hypothetical protein